MSAFLLFSLLLKIPDLKFDDKNADFRMDDIKEGLWWKSFSSSFFLSDADADAITQNGRVKIRRDEGGGLKRTRPKHRVTPMEMN